MKLNQDLLKQLANNSADYEYLNLNNQELSDQAIQDLVAALKSNTKTKVLDISYNNISDTGAKLLAQLKLTELNVGNNNISDSGAQALAQSCIPIIHLNDNPITSIGIEHLAKNSSLRCLNISRTKLDHERIKLLATSNKLTTLYLNQNSLDDVAAQLLAQSKSIEHLSIDDNQISDKGIISLASNRYLTSLSVCNNKITEQGAKALANNTTLGRLDISENPIAASGALSFMDNNTIIELGIQCQITLETCHKIVEHIANNQQKAELQRNHFVITVILLALAKSRNNDAALLQLPLGTLLHICSYLNFPSIRKAQIWRSGEQCAAFIFNNTRSIQERLKPANFDWPHILRLREKHSVNSQEDPCIDFAEAYTMPTNQPTI